MEANAANVQMMRDVILRSLSPENGTRKEAEAYIVSVEAQPGFSVVLLTLIQQLSAAQCSPEDVGVRQSAGVLFKNVVKRRWAPEGENEDLAPLSEADREPIRNFLVELMCITPSDVQKQLAEGVTLIAKQDFPANWTGLLGQLVSKLNSQDINVVNGVMMTANSIMKRFRHQLKSDELYAELIVCLKEFHVPLLTTFQQNWEQIKGVTAMGAGADKAALTKMMETHRLMTRVFFSLNWQDIPEQFEDAMPQWMPLFSEVLYYQNPLLVDDSEDMAAGPIERLQAAVLENINLYVGKYEEEFMPYLEGYTQTVWKMLMEVGPQQKYDLLAVSALRFLTTVSSKKMNEKLFTEQVLKDILQHIVMKNLIASESDEEMFEDNPTEYIRKDMEGSDQDTRRRCAIELVRSLLKYFDQFVSQTCEGLIASLLQQYQTNGDWKTKDAALHLLLASAAKNISCSELNPLVKMQEIFNTHVLVEAQDPNVNANPIVKADAIKLICLFRTHLPVEFLITLLPCVINHLKSEQVVVQTYAAICIERFLSIRDKAADGSVSMRITKEHIAPHSQALMTELFAVLENPELTENDYVMKCIMRLLAVLKSDIVPLTQLILNKLTVIFERVSKNPVNPHYNHYLFECYAVLIKSCCTAPGQTPEGIGAVCDQFEGLLFPPFQSILGQDVTEFTPYVFQIMAQLMAYRPGNGWSEGYRVLFAPVLAPVLWDKGAEVEDRYANVPGLTDLLHSYIRRDINSVLAANSLPGVLGVFQKLLASRITEQWSFRILDGLFMHCPLEALSQYVPTIFQLLLKRLQDCMTMKNKNIGYVRRIAEGVCTFALNHGGAAAFDALEAQQAGMAGIMIKQIWGSNIEIVKNGSSSGSKKIVVGWTRILCESGLMSDQEGWTFLLKMILSMIPRLTTQADKEHEGGMGAQEGGDGEGGREFGSSYSKLSHAAPPVVPLAAELEEAHKYFITRLGALCASKPGVYLPAIQAAVSESPELSQVLQKLSATYAVHLQ